MTATIAPDTGVYDLGRIADVAVSWVLDQESLTYQQPDPQEVSVLSWLITDEVWKDVFLFRMQKSFAATARIVFPCVAVRYRDTPQSASVPLVEVTHPVPVSLGIVPKLERAAAVFDNRSSRRDWRTYFHRLLHGRSERALIGAVERLFHRGLFTVASPERAEDGFRFHLKRFFLTRLEARREVSHSGEEGIRVTVHTEEQGRRVFFSPAYFFRPDHLFAQPSSPVSRNVEPGCYIFGVDDPQSTPRFDNTIYDIPPHTEAHVRVF